MAYRVTPIAEKTSITSRGENLTSSDSIKCRKVCRKFQDKGRTEKKTANHFAMGLKPGQLVFVKEVHRNVWRTGVTN